LAVCEKALAVDKQSERIIRAGLDGCCGISHGDFIVSLRKGLCRFCEVLIGLCGFVLLGRLRVFFVRGVIRPVDISNSFRCGVIRRDVVEVNEVRQRIVVEMAACFIEASMESAVPMEQMSSDSRVIFKKRSPERFWFIEVTSTMAIAS